MSKVWLEVEGGALLVDARGVCADVVPLGSLELAPFVGARFVGAVDRDAPLGLGDTFRTGTRPLFVIHDPVTGPALLRAPEITGVVETSGSLVTGEHLVVACDRATELVDEDDDPTERFSRARLEEERSTVRNLADLIV